MKLCYNQQLTLNYNSILDDIKFADKAGFEFIELHFDSLQRYLRLGGSLFDIKELFDTLKIKPTTVNGITLYPEFSSDFDNDIEKAQAIVDKLDLYYQLYHKLGCIGCELITPVVNDVEDLDLFPDYRIKSETIRILRSLIDNMSYVDWTLAPCAVPCGLVKDLDTLDDIVRSVGSRKAAATIDAYDLYLNDKEQNYDLSMLLGKEIKAVHLQNCIASDDSNFDSYRHATRLLDDSNVIDTNKILKELLKCGYEGTVSQKVNGDFYHNALTQEEVISKAYTSLKSELEKASALQFFKTKIRLLIQ